MLLEVCQMQMIHLNFPRWARRKVIPPEAFGNNLGNYGVGISFLGSWDPLGIRETGLGIADARCGSVMFGIQQY